MARLTVLYCTRCDVFPDIPPLGTFRHCLCTAQDQSAPIPPHWVWLYSDDYTPAPRGATPEYMESTE